MPHSADFHFFLDIFVHFYAFSGFFLKIHSHACGTAYALSFDVNCYNLWLPIFIFDCRDRLSELHGNMFVEECDMCNK